MPSVNLWLGGTSGDASVAANWSEGIPGSGDDVSVPPHATNGIIAGMDAIAGSTLRSFWVQDGFTKNIGNTAGGFFQVDLSSSDATHFRFEGNSTLARFHFIKTLQTLPIEVRKTGVGNPGQPAFQMITNDINTAGGVYMGTVSVYSGEVAFGPDKKLCEVAGLVIGSDAESGDAVVDIGENCRDDTSDGLLLNLWVNSGTVNCSTMAVNIDQHGGEINHTGKNITTLSLYGGVTKLQTPSGASGGTVLATLNLRGGTLDNSDNPSVKTITNANLHAGAIQDPLGKLVWTNPGVFKNKMGDVEFDFGPERTVTIA